MELARSQQPQGSFRDASLDMSFPALVCNGAPLPKATLLSMAYRPFRTRPWSPGQQPLRCPRSRSPTPPTPSTPASCPEILPVPRTLMHSHLRALAQAASSARNTCLPPCSPSLSTRPPLSPDASSRSFSWTPALSIPLGLSHQDIGCSSKNC